MYIAKKDFKYGANKFKKGEEVRVSDSIAKKLMANGDIKEEKEPFPPKKDLKPEDG